MRSVPTLLLSLCVITPVAATPPRDGDGTSQRSRVDAMKKLEFWVGEWKGSGWSLSAGGQRVEFAQVEKVESKVGGTVLVAEGRSVRKNERGEEVVTHDGLVLVSFDDAAGRYRWQGHDAERGATDAEVTRVEGGFAWSLATGEHGASVRFTILLDDTHWRETGEASADGRTWVKIMETELTRVGDRPGR